MAPSYAGAMASLAAQLFAVLGLGALLREATKPLSHRSSSTSEHSSIPRGELERIAERYGWWAARRAEAFCPEDDVACVEREARRLYQVVEYRRR